MPDYTVTRTVMGRIAELTKPHFAAISADLAEEYPDRPEWAYVLGIALGMSVMLGNIADAGERASAVQGINILMRHTGYTLRPVS